MIPVRKQLPLAPLPIQERKRTPAKKPRRSLTLRLVKRALLVLMVSALLASAAVHRHAQIAMKERDVARLTSQIAETKALNAKLHVEALELSSLQRIERIARQQLGMTNPQGNQILQVGVRGGN